MRNIRMIRPASLPNKESALHWSFVANSVTIFGLTPRQSGHQRPNLTYSNRDLMILCPVSVSYVRS